VSANEKNRRARGDYGVLHRSLEAVESKKKGDTVAAPWTTVVSHYSLLLIVYYSLHCSLFTIHYVVHCFR
jgi:hypothetical protein